MWLGLVPVAFAINLLLPAAEELPVGVGEALGCSGAGSYDPPVVTGWTSFRPALSWYGDTADDAIPVATDGFFAMHASGQNLAPGADEQLRVVVRDDAGAEVPGDFSALNEGLYGWVARQPLEVGARLTATLATEPATADVGGEFTLKVAGAPTALSAPVLRYAPWGTFYRGDGEVGSVQCEPTYGSCVFHPVALPPRVIEDLATDIVWTRPEIVGGVAWRVRVEPGAHQPRFPNGAEEWVFTGEYVGEYSPPNPDTTVAGITFRERAERYCVAVVITDLRTGLEQRSELCEAAGPLVGWSNSDTSVDFCIKPPTAELTRAWCDLRRGTLPECTAAAEQQPGTQPDSGSGAGTGAATGADAATGANAAADDGRTDEERSVIGCTLGSASSGTPALTSLVGLTLAWLRRRARRVEH